MRASQGFVHAFWIYPTGTADAIISIFLERKSAGSSLEGSKETGRIVAAVATNTGVILRFTDPVGQITDKDLILYWGDLADRYGIGNVVDIRFGTHLAPPRWLGCCWYLCRR